MFVTTLSVIFKNKIIMKNNRILIGRKGKEKSSIFGPPMLCDLIIDDKIIVSFGKIYDRKTALEWSKKHGTNLWDERKTII